FQAEDGIRDDLVTGVQTCALPICASGAHVMSKTALRTGEASVTGANPLLAGMRTARTPVPCALVIFGASGDLTMRKLVPGLYALASEGSLPAGFTVVGAGRTAMTDDEFRASMRQAVKGYGRVRLGDDLGE